MARTFNPRELAASMLARRPLSEKELLKKLEEKGVEPREAGQTVAWMHEIGAVDDEKYAEVIARHYSRKGFGASRIKQELSRRGIGRETALRVLESAEPCPDAIDRFIEKKLGGVKEPDRAELKRLNAALQRRGFGWQEIKEAIDRYLSRE
ncbi:MAG: regulatory protein RecX [Oscillospiraceae bacterium]|jgi:regulatory protein